MLLVNKKKQKKGLGKYSYKVFGLNIASEILLPELLPAIDTPDIADVDIYLGQVPDEIDGVIEKTKNFQAAKNQFLLHIPGVGRYYVTNGNRIVVEPFENVQEMSVRVFLLGTAFGALLLQRGILPIHGSAVVINGCAVILTGVSGAGKSTLLAAFRERGYSFITDDVAAVTVNEDGIAIVHSAYPQQKLWRDSADIIGVDTNSLTPFYSQHNKDKFVIPVHKGFWQSPVRLVGIYEIRVDRCRDVTLKRLSGVDKLAVLMNHTYRSWLIDGLNIKPVHFQQCVAVARQVAVSRLTRPEGVFSLDEQVRLLEQDLGTLQL